MLEDLRPFQHGVALEVRHQRHGLLVLVAQYLQHEAGRNHRPKKINKYAALFGTLAKVSQSHQRYVRLKSSVLPVALPQGEDTCFAHLSFSPAWQR